MLVARDVMTRELDCVNEGRSVRAAAALMAELGARSLPVCDDHRDIIGIISDRDLVIDAVADGAEIELARVGDMVHRNGAVLCEDDTLDRVIDLLAAHQRCRLPVADGGRLVGVLGQAELARRCPESMVDRLLWLIGLDL